MKQTPIKWISATLAIGLLVIALWVPYGINFAGYGDEWVNLSSVDMGTPWILGTLRPFLNVMYGLAHVLTPDSFAGMNIILAIMTFGRGLGIYALIRQLLSENPALALVAGGLTAVYIGDVGFYALVCISITTALVCFICAIIALIRYWQQPKLITLVVMGVLIGFSIGIYEVSYPLIAAAPVILVYLNAGLSLRVLRVSLYWYAVPLTYVLINLFTQLTSNNTASYQLSIISADNSLLSIIRGFGEVYIREFGRVWQWAELSMPQGFSDGRTWLVIVVTLIFGAALRLHMKAVKPASNKRYITILLGGFATLGIGYSLFAFTAYRDGFYRTLFYGLPGAAIALAIAFWLLSRTKRLPRVIMAFVFVVIGVIYVIQLDRLSALLVFGMVAGFAVKSGWNYVLMGASLVGYAGAAMMGFHIMQPFADLPNGSATFNNHFS